MNNKNWQPTKYQKIAHLQKELRCPNEFIFDFLKDIQQKQARNSFKFKAKNYKEVNFNKKNSDIKIHEFNILKVLYNYIFNLNKIKTLIQ